MSSKTDNQHQESRWPNQNKRSGALCGARSVQKMGKGPGLIVNCISLSGVREAESLETNLRYIKFLLTLAAPVSLPPGGSDLREKEKVIDYIPLLYSYWEMCFQWGSKLLFQLVSGSRGRQSTTGGRGGATACSRWAGGALTNTAAPPVRRAATPSLVTITWLRAWARSVGQSYKSYMVCCKI